MPTETTLVLIKPDAVARGLIAEILGRFSAVGSASAAYGSSCSSAPRPRARYAEHRERPFFGELVDFITSGPLVAMALEGNDAISTVRTMMGETHPTNSAPGTIRGDLALELAENVVHGSDSPESAERELAIFFGAALLS